MHLVLLPHQLFEPRLLPKGHKSVVLYEHPYFFSHPKPSIKYHKQKLMLHRASMQAYADLLKKQGITVQYIDFVQGKDGIIPTFNKLGIKSICYIDPVDNFLEAELRKFTQSTHAACEAHPTPQFLTSRDILEKYFYNKDKFSLSEFYIQQRKRMNILLDKEGKPLGGKWSFDAGGRNKIPKGTVVPNLPKFEANHYINAARDYVQQFFPDNPGSVDNFIYPITHRDAEKWLHDFIKQRLQNYGSYQEAIAYGGNFLFHSVLSPMMNIGLINPEQIVGEVLEFYAANQKKVSLASVESFIRQIIGWREFVHGVYVFVGEKQRESNFWKHEHKLPKCIWNNNVGIFPVNMALERVHSHAYTHHSERLMVLANWMMLCEIHPDSIYDWFMSMFIDAYDWVMVPNVYGLSQNADGGLMSTKPYISGSGYLRKSSNFKSGEWCDIWDGLFWRFIAKNKKAIKSNPRLSVIGIQLSKMTPAKLKQHVQIADNYLDKLYAGAEFPYEQATSSKLSATS